MGLLKICREVSCALADTGRDLLNAKEACFQESSRILQAKIPQISSYGLAGLGLKQAAQVRGR